MCPLNDNCSCHEADEGEQHGSVQLYLGAEGCPHPEPPEPDGPDDTGWTAWDAWHDDHPSSSNFNGDLICLLSPSGTACPACTDVAREEEDLPLDEYVACRMVLAEQ